MVLHLLIDTSTWLDLAKRRDGQRIIVPLRQLVDDGLVDLLVPQLVIDEFDRNRASVEASMTSSMTERIRLIREDVNMYLSDDDFEGFLADFVFERWSYKLPLIGAMTTRNLGEIRDLLDNGTPLVPTVVEHERVVARGLTKRAPFHRSRNCVADALLIEMYKTALASVRPGDTCAFITSNYEDFSLVKGDRRLPHADLADLFAGDNSIYRYDVLGLAQLLVDEFADEITEMVGEIHLVEQPRGLEEIAAAERQMFDKIWYERSMRRDRELIADGKTADLEEHRRVAAPAREQIEKTYTVDDLAPHNEFDLGMLHGKLSALRWVLGSEWDFLDT